MKETKITPIILAAGDSKRMGFPKALLPIAADTFLTVILKTLENLELTGTIVVLGKHAAQIQSQITERPTHVVINRKPEEGQLSSIKLALDALDSTCNGCLLWPVDLPAVSETLVRALIRLFSDSGAPLALPLYGKRRGHPAIFRRALFHEILHTPIQEGLKGLVSRHREEIALLPTEEIAAIEDIDTPEDYFRLTGERLESALRRRGQAIPPR